MLTISPDWELKIPCNLAILLGLKENPWRPMDYEQSLCRSKKPRFALYKTIYVHLEQLNTYENTVDRAPSRLLQAIPVGISHFGAIEDFQFERPLVKRLQGGTISELKLALCDKENRPIDNHSLVVVAMLKIME